MKSYGLDVKRRQYRIPEPLNERLEKLVEDSPLNKSQVVRLGIMLAARALEAQSIQEDMPTRSWGLERFLADRFNVERDYI